MIKSMIANCAGLSSDLDKTLTALANAVDDADKIRLMETVKVLRAKARKLQKSMTELRLGYENREVSSERIEATRRNVRQAFLKNSQVIYWYENTLNESFFAMMEEPALRIALINEVILQATSRWPEFKAPQLWTTLIENQGLMDNKE